jgi:cytochrome bd-type quinol oxidase subunit 2
MATGSSLGVGRVLIAIYAVFAVSATARASYQLITKYEQAPLAYSLSALSAAIYIFATFALVKTSGRWPILARAAIYTELVGVLAVGLMSYLMPDLFGHPSVWSKFGQGYGYIPLVLPILGLVWLSKRKAS